MAGTDLRTPTAATARLRPWEDRPARAALTAPLYTVADVSRACGLPGPVIMQLVPRTWTDQGYLYTAAQRDAAVAIAADLRG